MTAEHLINGLKKLPPDTKIVVRGYENGYNDIIELKPVNIKKLADSHWYDGEYGDSTDADALTAVNLFGKNNSAKD